MHTFTLKITIKESDLVYLEDPTSLDSLALIGFTTAVVTCNDSSGIIEANLEIKVFSFNIFFKIIFDF